MLVRRTSLAMVLAVAVGGWLSSAALSGCTDSAGSGGACDLAVDEGCACTAGATEACYSGDPATVGVGRCAKGLRACQDDGTWGACEGEVIPAPENCNGLDDDCDFQVDEEVVPVTCGLGACQTSVEGCVKGVPPACVPLSPSPIEACDSIDDDCDGEVDEGCSCQDEQAQECYSGPAGALGVGECTVGTQTCVDGAFGACYGEVLPSPEVCDDLDNDCDGATDEGNPGGGAACITGQAGLCTFGTLMCQDGSIACVQDLLASMDVCDGLDNDCDGTLDNGPFCCPDGQKNGNESDVDCGAACPGKCGAGRVCASPADCDSGVCEGSLCKAPACSDGIKNGAETGLDCGPPCPGKCGAGGACASPADCDSGVCEGSVCKAPMCGDGVKNGAEPCDDANMDQDDDCTVNCVLQRVEKLWAGPSHNCALLTGGVHKCWGNNYYGKLGLGYIGGGDLANRGDDNDEMGFYLPAVDLGAGKTATHFALGAEHTCARLSDYHVKCWGDQDTGQLGMGNFGEVGDAPGEMGDSLPALDLGSGKGALSITAGAFHTCALLDDDTIKCWGDNTYGQLGLGDTQHRGDQVFEMGNNLPAVKLGTGKVPIAFAAGTSHTCALLSDGSVKCWGRNQGGQLGLGDTQSRGDGPNEMGDNLPAVSLGTGKTAVALAAGEYHTCALLNDGSVKCWGANGDGTLGLGDDLPRGTGPNQMGDSLPAVDLGTAKTAVAIAARFLHTCAVLNDGSLKCWGWNGEGQLGLGDVAVRGDGPNEMGDNLPAVSLGSGRTVLAVDTGAGHTCARLDNGSAKCWGDNTYGAIGIWYSPGEGTSAGDMGDNLPVVTLFSNVW